MIRQAAVDHAGRVATRAPRGNDWVTKTYARLGSEVEALARVLIDADVQVGDRVMILSANRPEWSVADFAVLSCGAVVVPVSQVTTADLVRRRLEHCGATVAFAGDQRDVDVLLAAATDALRLVVAFEPVTVDDERVRHVDDLLADPPSRGSATELAERLAQGSPDDLASIVYTSGTSAEAKGVMLSHGGFVDQVTALASLFPITPADHSLCFLPLAHAYERAWTYAVVAHGCMNTYCPEPGRVGELLRLVQPTLLCAVPRLLEGVYADTHAAAAPSRVRRRVLGWALGVGGKVQRRYSRGKRPGPLRQTQLDLADKVVLRRIRDAIGGPKTVLACGGGPLRREVEEFFSAAGVLVCQGYGLTEASPLVSCNAPSGFRFGTSGRVMPGSSLRVAASGEIEYQGPNVMLGYWRDPEATEAALADGWLRTGDVGHLDEEGFLVVTDRMADIVVTTDGERIAPSPIEQALLADPLFEQAVLVGNRRPYATLLVQPSTSGLEALAQRLQVTWQHRSELATHPSVVAGIKERVAAAVEKLPDHDRIKDLRLLLDEFTLESGLLTPTLKVRRREVERRFASLIDEMYARLTRD